MKTMILLMTLSIMVFYSPVYSQETSKQDQIKQNPEKKTNGPVADYDKTVCDLGDLIQNSPGTAVFTLSNRGNEPLVISSATASCGCTNLLYSKDPILPGKSTTISATYNAAATGNFIKTVTIRTNASEQPTTLQIKGKVNTKS